MIESTIGVLLSFVVFNYAYAALNGRDWDGAFRCSVYQVPAIIATAIAIALSR